MIKIVQLVPRDGIGGVECAAHSMLNAPHDQCDFNLVFISKDHPLEHRDDGSVPWSQSENNPLVHFRAFRHIISMQPDLLVCSLWRSVPIGLVTKLIRPRIKLVFFLHNTKTAHLLDRLLSGLMVSFCDAVWADSVATMSSRAGSKKGLVKRVISFVTKGSPVDLMLGKLAPRFVFWGRLRYQKGLNRAVNLIQILVERGCPATFEIWGPDGGELDSLKIQIESLGLENTIFLKGSADYDELNQIAERSSFYLQLSHNEGMAMSVVEAMQRSLVPVVTPVGEIGTYCKANYNAILVHDPDNPIESVDEIVSLLENEAEYRRLQLAAYNHWSQHILHKDDFFKAACELFPSD